MADQLFVPIVWAVMVIGVGLTARLISTAILNRTVREALRLHPPSASLLLEKVVQRQPWIDSLLGVGTIAIATGVAMLAVHGDPSERYARVEAAFLIALIGAALLFFAQVQREALQAIVRQQTQGIADASTYAWLDADTSWADAVLMSMATAIILAFVLMTLASYWRDYPAIIAIGLLASLAIAAITLVRRKRPAGGGGQAPGA